MKDMKPLFIPLKSEYYKKFAIGEKRDELRVYGPRWNEKTCHVGRDVILSKGYGKKNRLKGRIWRFEKKRGVLFRDLLFQKWIKEIYGTLDIDIAYISLKNIEPINTEQSGARDCSENPLATPDP